MKWKKITIKTIPEAEDIIISTMYDLGLEGAQIEDKVPLTAWEKEQMFVDILPDAVDNDGVAYLNFFVEVPSQEDEGKDVKAQEEKKNTKDKEVKLTAGLSDGVDNSYMAVSNQEYKDIPALIEDMKRELEDLSSFMDIGEGTITLSETEDKDWLNNWKEFFHQFYIDDLLVTPSWEKVKSEDKDKKVLHIDPGTAFGTGMHETTQLCIRSLRKYISPQTQLLDIGTGSGILAIVALLYGIKNAVGTDLDPCASPAVEENLQMNGISKEKMKLLIGNIITDQKIQDEVGYSCYDIVCANILAEVLVVLTPVIEKAMKPGAYYITSGIINGKESLVIEACQKVGMELIEVTSQGEWMSVTCKKPN